MRLTRRTATGGAPRSEAGQCHVDEVWCEAAGLWIGQAARDPEYLLLHSGDDDAESAHR